MVVMRFFATASHETSSFAQGVPFQLFTLHFTRMIKHTFTFLSILTIGVANATTVTVDFSDVAFAAFVDGAGPITIQDVAVDVDGVAVTFDLTISGDTSSAAGDLDFNVQRVHFDGDARQTTATLSISDVQGALSYDGMSGMNFFDSGGNDPLTINGVPEDNKASETYVFKNNRIITGDVTFVATTNDPSRLQGLRLDFTVARPAASTGPNILFILVDDWGWTEHSSATMASDGGSSYQSPYFQTPNFDTLVSEGIALTSTYAQPNCAPTRAALLSGQYSPRHGNGVYNVSSLNRSGSGRTTYTTAANQGDEHMNGDKQTITIAEAFYNSGYVTAHFGKYHAGATDPNDPTFPLNQGFDYNYGGQNHGDPGSYFASGGASSVFSLNIGPELDPFAGDYDATYIANYLTPYANGNDPADLLTTAGDEKKHITDAMADAFISFANNHQAGSLAAYPFYAQVHFYAVHTPIEPRSDLLAKYNGITPPAGTAHTDAKFAALIEGMDQSLGRILDYLDDPNGDGNPSDSIAANTLVVFCSDNGGHEEINAPLRNKKGSHYQGGIRVPAVVRMPGTVPAGKVSDTLTHVVDFYPTMLDFANGVYPDSATHPLDGVSLFNHVKDPDNVARNREPIFYHFPGYMDDRAYNCSMMIKDVDGKRYKYIYSYDPYYAPSENFDQYQLYNLTDDIGESVNLLDYIDVENAGDSGDPSTSEEYWNYILNKDLGNAMAADLHSWLDHGTANPSDPADPTWNPIYSVYKSTFPGIDSALIGKETGPAPATIAEIEVPIAETFRVTSSSVDASNNVSLTFLSEPGFTYQIQGTSTMESNDWADLGSPVTPSAGTSTTHTVPDPTAGTEDKRFYRVTLMAQ